MEHNECFIEVDLHSPLVPDELRMKLKLMWDDSLILYRLETKSYPEWWLLEAGTGELIDVFYLNRRWFGIF